MCHLFNVKKSGLFSGFFRYLNRRLALSGLESAVTCMTS